MSCEYSEIPANVAISPKSPDFIFFGFLNVKNTLFFIKNKPNKLIKHSYTYKFL